MEDKDVVCQKVVSVTGPKKVAGGECVIIIGGS